MNEWQYVATINGSVTRPSGVVEAESEEAATERAYALIWNNYAYERDDVESLLVELA